MGRRRHEKGNVLMGIVAVLLCATLASIHLVGGLYAKYTTSASGSDSARVAKFSITQKFLNEKNEEITQAIEAKVTPGTTQSVKLEIANKSEVAVEYALTVTNVTGNLPLKFKLTPVSGNNAPAVTSESYQNGVSKCSAVQKPGNHTDKYNLQIDWTSSGDDSDLAYIGMVDYITISVTATQID